MLEYEHVKDNILFVKISMVTIMCLSLVQNLYVKDIMFFIEWLATIIKNVSVEEV